MVSEVEVALLKKHAEIMTHEASLQRMESDLRARETVILLKEAKLEKKPNRLKRGAEEEAVGQRNRKMFCDLKERRKYQLVSDTVKAVTNLGRGNAVDLLRAVNKRVFGETGEEQVNFVWTLLRNIAEFSAHYLPPPDRQVTHGSSLDPRTCPEGCTRADTCPFVVHRLGSQRG